MQMIVKREWPAYDASTLPPEHMFIPEGTHEIERIPGPVTGEGFWLVLKGTLIGAAEGFWRDWIDPIWEDYQVQIIE